MADKMATEQRFRERDYLLGRVPLPPWIHNYKSRPFVYGEDKSIANGASGRIDVTMDDDSHFLVEGISIISSDQTRSQDLATVQITDTTSGRNWSNDAVPLRDLAGKGDSAKILTDPNIMRPTSSLAVQITNSIGSTAQFYVAFIGRKIYDLPKEKADFLAQRAWYQYVMNAPALTAGISDVKATLQIYKDADFIVKRMLSSQLIGQIIGATAGAESAEVMMNLRNTGSDVTLCNKKLAARLLLGQLAGEVFSNAASWGNGAAFPLKKPWLVRRSSTIEGAFDNRANATIAASKLVLEGASIYNPA